MTAFKDIIFDIVGYCNAKCPYCITGANKCHTGEMISLLKFETVIAKLVRIGAANTETVVQLYCWGEPFLHPDLNGIIEILNRYNIRFVLSTNGSIRSALTLESSRGMRNIIVSMPGFSQKSYNRIHKLNFKTICSNIVDLRNSLKSFNYIGDIVVNYHVYQFNLAELWECETFTLKHGLVFKPSYAIINEWSLLNGWIEGTLPVEKMREISENLFCFNIRETMCNAPLNYSCPQHEYLIIDAAANVNVCCQLPGLQEYLCGNIITDDFNDILRKKRNRPVCKSCLSSGLSYYINTCLFPPEFYLRKKCSGFHGSFLQKRFYQKLKVFLSFIDGRYSS